MSRQDTTLDAFRAQIETNFFGVVNVTKAALLVLRQQSAGHVIQISSLGGRIATSGCRHIRPRSSLSADFSEALAQEVEPLGIKVTVIEPRGMRTDWGGSSMTIPPVSAAYAPTVGAFAAVFESGAAALAIGDPPKVARVVLEVAERDEPPLRLLLGSDGVAYARDAATARAVKGCQGPAPRNVSRSAADAEGQRFERAESAVVKRVVRPAPSSALHIRAECPVDV